MSGGSAIAVGALWGAAAGGLVGSIGFPALGLGSSRDGFFFGAAAGASGGALGGWMPEVGGSAVTWAADTANNIGSFFQIPRAWLVNLKYSSNLSTVLYTSLIPAGMLLGRALCSDGQSFDKSYQCSGDSAVGVDLGW